MRGHLDSRFVKDHLQSKHEAEATFGMSLFSLPTAALSSVLTNITDTAFEDHSVHKSVTQNNLTESQRQFPRIFTLRHTACVKAGEAPLLSEPHSAKCTLAPAAVSQSVCRYPLPHHPRPCSRSHLYQEFFFITLHEWHQGE